MIPITLSQAAVDAGGALDDPADLMVTGVVSDTRQIGDGDLFVAIAGDRVDGATLAGAAIKAGAAGILTADPDIAANSGAPRNRIIAVDDPLIALGSLARESLRRARAANPALKVVAVTGSVGKTTTKDLLALLLAIRGPIIAPPGSFNNELGLPLTVLRAGADTATLVLEMGADRIGNITYLTSIAPPDVSVVLAVARAHLGEFGGIANVAKAKSELVTGMKPDGVVILNGNDERVRPMADLTEANVFFFGVQGLPGPHAESVRLDPLGHPMFTLVTPRGRAEVTLGLVGHHHVSNALAAAAVADSFGIGADEIAQALADTGPVSPHRMAVTEREGVLIIDDSYNANPDSMRAGLNALGSLGKNRRKIAVLGAMLELGEASEAEHAAIGEYAHKSGVEVVVAVGEEMTPLVVAAQACGIEVYETGADTALAVLSPIIAEGDVILFKGSNGSGVWRVADALLGKES